MTRPQDEANGIARIAAGDAATARRVRANLAVFARRDGDPATAKLVNEVLSGERDIRDVVNSPQFRRAGNSHLANLEEGLRRLPTAERNRMLQRALHRDVVETDPAELDALRGAGLDSSPLDEDGEVDSVDRPRPNWPT